MLLEERIHFGRVCGILYCLPLASSAQRELFTPTVLCSRLTYLVIISFYKTLLPGAGSAETSLVTTIGRRTSSVLGRGWFTATILLFSLVDHDAFSAGAALHWRGVSCETFTRLVRASLEASSPAFVMGVFCKADVAFKADVLLETHIEKVLRDVDFVRRPRWHPSGVF